MAFPAITSPEDRLFATEYVQLHGVSQEDGQESRTFLAEGPLVVGRLKGSEMPILQIGMPENMSTWQLTPELPVLKVQACTYMFAVPYSRQFYIVYFLPEAPKSHMAVFEGCLQRFTSFAVDKDVPVDTSMEGAQSVQSEDGTQFTTSPELAQQIRAAGTAVASGVHTVGDLVGRGIVSAGEWYRGRTKQRTSDTPVSERTKARIATAKNTTNAVAKATTAVAGAIGDALGYAAHSATQGLKKSGVAKEGSSTRTYATIGKAGLVAVVEVFDAMHDAGRSAVQTGAQETATCVQYRYGEEAAEATRQGMGMAVDAYDVYGAYKQMRTSAMARAFAKGTVRNPYDKKGKEEGGGAASEAGGSPAVPSAPPAVPSDMRAGTSMYPPPPEPPKG